MRQKVLNWLEAEQSTYWLIGGYGVAMMVATALGALFG